MDTSFSIVGVNSGSGAMPASAGAFRSIKIDGSVLVVVSTGPFSRDAIEACDRTSPPRVDVINWIIGNADARVSRAIANCHVDDTRPFFPTSIAVIGVSSTDVSITWIGDFYAAIVRDRRILWKTHPHTLQYEYKLAGDNRATISSYANVVSRCLGPGATGDPEHSPITTPEPGDILVVGPEVVGRFVESSGVIDAGLESQSALAIREEVLACTPQEEPAANPVLVVVKWS